MLRTDTGGLWARALLSSLILLLGAGCDSASPDGPDSGVTDGGVTDGGAAMTDAGATDAGVETDGGALAGDAAVADAGPCACAADEVCVRDVCLASCGLEPESIEAALGADLTPLSHTCRSAHSRSFGDGQVWDLTTTATGTVTTFELSRWRPGASSPGELSSVGTTTFDTGDAAEMLFPGNYLPLSPNRMRAAFGYTALSDSDGEVFVLEGGSATRIPALGNYAATFLDDDTLLINGLAAGAVNEDQGVYAIDLGEAPPSAAYVLTNMGAYSGSVEATDEFIVAGGVDGETFAGTVWAISSSAFRAAIGVSEIDVDTGATIVTDPEGTPIPSTFRRVGDRLVTLPFGGPITSYAVDFDGTELTLSDAVVLVQDGTFTDVLGMSDGQLGLGHTNGLLVVR